MKSLLYTTVTALCLSASITGPAIAAEPAVCEPHITKAPVRLSRRTLELQQTGVVIVQAQVDATGRADNVLTLVSSGKSRLDAAAERAVRKRWQFDVAQCAASTLPAMKVVAVEFTSAATAVAATDQCFHSSRASAYGRQRTSACLNPVQAPSTLARAAAK